MLLLNLQVSKVDLPDAEGRLDILKVHLRLRQALQGQPESSESLSHKMLTLTRIYHSKVPLATEVNEQSLSEIAARHQLYRGKIGKML